FILWIGLGFIGVGQNMFRSWEEGKEAAAMVVAIGVIAFAIGLCCSGVHRALARLAPVPRDTLSVPIVWTLLVISVAMFAFGYGIAPHISPQLIRIAGALVGAGLGAAGVLSILLMTAFRGAILSKLLGVVMLTLVIGSMAFLLFSRRPIPGLLGALVGVVYHIHVRHRSLGTRLVFLGSSAGVVVIAVLFLTAFRGFLVKGSSSRVSSESTARSLIGGVTINIEVLEFVTVTYGTDYDYLNGSGMVPAVLWWIPRAAWPGKPIPSGGIVSDQYTGGKSFSVASTIFGEVYQNFGLPGIPVWMFIFGILVGTITRILRDNEHNLTLWVAWFIVIPDFIGEWRGDLTSMSVQGFLRVAFFLAATWALGKAFPKAAPMRMPVGAPRRRLSDEYIRVGEARPRRVRVQGI
ncbi:MAG: oligosaccharide repeat unit polymerase, partial [Phycisphaerales bacterium]|nr:oligosaccharide repeat unit polymerase [Phycisphaerales bacterium]